MTERTEQVKRFLWSTPKKGDADGAGESGPTTKDLTGIDTEKGRQSTVRKAGPAPAVSASTKMSEEGNK